jgi:R.Pab1 restriction endonuclease
LEKTSTTQSGKPLPDGFMRFVEDVPLFEKETRSGCIEIQLKQKQRAVGYQAMVYVCLPFDKIITAKGEPRPAGPAHTKETVRYIFSAENIDFLFDIVRAFGIASRQHNEDLTKILDAILAS